MNAMRTALALLFAIPAIAVAQIDDGGFQRAHARYDNGGSQSAADEGDGSAGSKAEKPESDWICPGRITLDVSRPFGLDEEPEPDADACLAAWSHVDCAADHDLIHAEADARCIEHCQSGLFKCLGRIEDFVTGLICEEYVGEDDEALFYPACAAEVVCTCYR